MGSGGERRGRDEVFNSSFTPLNAVVLLCSLLWGAGTGLVLPVTRTFDEEYNLLYVFLPLLISS